MKPVYAITFIWMIIVGALMITNLGVFCIACGVVVNKLAAAVTIVLGAAGLYYASRGGPVARN
jgi:hypothetical protein